MKFGKGYWKTFEAGIEREWVTTNGIGGYAGSSIIGANTRNHQGLLVASLRAPVSRYALLTKINEKMDIGGKEYSLYTNQHPGGWNEEGQKYLQRFIYEENPKFVYQAEEVFLTKEIAFEWEKNTIAVAYEITNGSKQVKLSLTPLFTYREHNDNKERAELKFEYKKSKDTMYLIPEDNKELLIKAFIDAGNIVNSEEMYVRDLEYQTEIATGGNCIDNAFTPYTVEIDVAPYETRKISFICSIEEDYEKDAFKVVEASRDRIKGLVELADLKDEFADTLVKAADQFIVQRKSTGYKTVMAGYPWFTDWGRDTMIALQGLTLVTKRYDDAKGILKTFAKYIKNGLVPNMFPDEGVDPIYNTVDAAMWYFYSVDKYLEYTGKDEDYEFIKEEIYPKLEEIIAGYKNGTEFSIYMDKDYLIHAGGGFDQVTWMDVRVGEWVVTPRHGKPVEISALWYNALRVMEKLAKRFGKNDKEYGELAEKVKKSFNEKFWNEEKGCLYDVVDDSGNDPKIRPNQIYAVSLPYTMLDDEKSKKIVETVMEHLYASYGLRSLSPQDEEYIGQYKGKLHDRDAAYHQGTTWAFPLGGFITAYVKVNGGTEEAKKRARMMIEPLEDHLRDGCVGSIAEIFDGNEPIISRGCYAQAWSVGEILRAYVEDVM